MKQTNYVIPSNKQSKYPNHPEKMLHMPNKENELTGTGIPSSTGIKHPNMQSQSQKKELRK